MRLRSIIVCVKHKGGALYKARKCAEGDKKLTWNAQGPSRASGTQGLPGAQGANGGAGAMGPQGPQGATGPQGLTGPQGTPGTPGATNVTVKSNTESVPTNIAAEQTVSCPAGAVATGGGAHIGTGGGGLVLSRSQPLPTTGTPTGWDAIAENASGATTEFTVYVICASP